MRAERPQYVRLKLSSLLISRPWAHQNASSAYAAAMRFLFRPRVWVERLGRCFMRTERLVSRAFISVHIRQSVEKNAEARNHLHRMPRVASYVASAVTLSHALGLHHVHVQTSSALALAKFTRLVTSAQKKKEPQTASARKKEHQTTSARKTGVGEEERSEERGLHAEHGFEPTASALSLSATDNPRGEHDTWGGWAAAHKDALTGTGKDASKGARNDDSVDETLDGTVTTTDDTASAHVTVTTNATNALMHATRHDTRHAMASYAKSYARADERMRGVGTTVAPLTLRLCCGCGGRDGGANLIIAVSGAVPRPAEIWAAQSSSRCPPKLSRWADDGRDGH